MRHVVFYPKGKDIATLDRNEEGRRVTVQLRSYDRKGIYSSEMGTASIKFKGILIDDVWDKLLDVLMKSGEFSFVVEENPRRKKHVTELD